MIRRWILGLIIALWTLPCAPLIRAQSPDRPNFFRPPAKVRLEGLIRRRFPEYYGKAFPQEQLIIEEFFPIGWSKDGKFAYYAEPPDEACGCYSGQLVIVDLVNDKVLWSFDYNGLDHQDDDPRKVPKSIYDLWITNRKLFSDKLNQFGIVPQRRWALLLFPLNQTGDRLTTEMKIREIADEEQRIYGSIEKATLQLVSRRQGKKTIFDKTYGEDDSKPLALKVLGALKSPYEQRIAIVMIGAYRGYEGPPHTTAIHIVGAALGSGFK